jgi:hypothetical protein
VAIGKVVLTEWVKNTALRLSVLKNEGENDLLVNGENWIQRYCCVLGWVGNLNIRWMVILLGPGGERLGKGRVGWGSENS